MRASPSEWSSEAPLGGRARRLIGLWAGAYVVAHLPFVARALEDIDSINFALGLQRFDVAAHQPHPPGYPLYIALGRVVHQVAKAAHPGEPFHETAAIALALLSALCAGLAVWALGAIFSTLDRGRSIPSRSTWPWATALVACAPLFWMSGLRPMSDIVGLAAALVAVAAVLHESWRPPTRLVVATAVAGLAAGVRVQTALLTLPLLALVGGRMGLDARAYAAALAALGAGALVWAVPLVWASGGVAGYLLALRSQADEDFSWVAMLWANPTLRRLAEALKDSLVHPWSLPWLAALVLALAAAGLVIALRRDRTTLLFLTVGFGPYAAFHLLLQETSHVRYALPLLVPVAWLAARAVTGLGAAGPLLGVVVVAVSLWQDVSASTVYARQRHPAFRAIGEMMRQAAEPGAPTRVFSHYALYRALQVGASAPLVVVPPVRNQEWMGPLDYWRQSGQGEVWFLADPRRMDLELLDPRSMRRGETFPWDVSRRPELGGARPVGADFLRLSAPRWMVGPGWSLSPEAGGRVRADGTGPNRRPIEAYLRRGPDPLVVVLGGRYLGRPDGPSTVVTVDLDGRRLDEWTVDHRASPSFLRVLRLAEGVQPAADVYATLRVSTRSTDGGPPGELAIRQFDAGSDTPLLAFGQGWHEDEYEPPTGLRWRWSSDRSELFVVAAKGASLVIRGESSVKYFGQPPLVRASVGDRTLAELRPDADFEWRVPIPPGVLPVGGGTVTLSLDRAYLPGPAEGTSDTRRLGLRTFSVKLLP